MRSRWGRWRIWIGAWTLGWVLLGVSDAVSPVFAQSDDPLCEAYPLYCVPLAGGAPEESLLFGAEASDTREIQPSDDLAPGVVRGVTDEGIPFIGNPDAPLRLRLYENFTCGHCLNYHEADFQQFLTDYVMTGQAVFEVQLLSFGARPYSDNAAFAALCAAEQDAYWEMTSALFEEYENRSAVSAYALDVIRERALELGLDDAQLMSCVTAGRYAERLPANLAGAYDLGVSGTPSVVVQVEDAPGWALVQRDYDTLADLAAAANGTVRHEYGFTTISVDGEAVSLADFHGRNVLLFFWNSGCDDCMTTVDAMNSFHRLHLDENFTVLGVTLMEGVAQVEDTIAAGALQFPVVLDLQGDLVAQYSVGALPAAFLFDGDGDLVAQWDGTFDLEALERQVRPLIASH